MDARRGGGGRLLLGLSEIAVMGVSKRELRGVGTLTTVGTVVRSQV